MLRDIKKTALLSAAVAGLAVLGLGSSVRAGLVSITAGGSSQGYTQASNTVDFNTLTYVTSIMINPFKINDPLTGSLEETGTITEGVFRTGGGPGVGTLDFAYQFTLANMPGNDIKSVVAAFFQNYTISAGLGTDLGGVIGTNPFSPPMGGTGGSLGDIAGNVQESTGGSVTFDFSNEDKAATSGTALESDVFVIATNATTYAAGAVALEDDLNSPDYIVYGPATAPLPATAGTGLALLGCLGAFSVIRRRVMA